MKIPKIIRDYTESDNWNLRTRGLKLMEESGEVAAEILKLDGHKGRKGKTEKEVLAHLRLEAVDVLVVAFSILHHTGATEKEIDGLIKQQLKK